MKKSQNQTGSAHVVIIIILILAILGLLGFVFWQNFIQKKDTATTTSSATTSTSTAQITPKTTMTALSLSSYGAEVPYDSATDTYSAVLATTGGFAGGYTIYSAKVTAACGSGVNIGVLKRFNKNDSIPGPSNHVTVGDYTYALGVGGYGDCGTGSAETVLENTLNVFTAAFNNLKLSN